LKTSVTILKINAYKVYGEFEFMGKKKPLPPGYVQRGTRYFCPCGIPFTSKKGAWEHHEDFHVGLKEPTELDKLKRTLERRLKTKIHFDMKGFVTCRCGLVLKRIDLPKHKTVCRKLFKARMLRLSRQ